MSASPSKQPRAKLFPKRPQGCGFPSERAAVQAAREALGAKAKKGLAFVISADNGTFGWLSASTREVVDASIAAQVRKSTQPAKPRKRVARSRPPERQNGLEAPPIFQPRLPIRPSVKHIGLEVPELLYATIKVEAARFNLSIDRFSLQAIEFALQHLPKPATTENPDP